MPANRPKPLALVIMDGYGIAPREDGDATRAAKTPYLDELFKNNPTSQLGASGESVGLPDGQMGNSEVGHLNLGSGRIIYQDYTRINKALEDDELISNPKIREAFDHAKSNKSALHLMGLLSDGGVHSHIRHLFGLLEAAKRSDIKDVYIHAILDGRDTPPQSAIKYLEELENKIDEIGIGEIATVSGRYYTMDRDNRWERTELAYNALVLGEGKKADSVIKAVKKSYQDDVDDEFVIPVVINSEGRIKDDDSVFVFNFRADRVRQITKALALENFDKFKRPKDHPDNLYYLCMTEYDEEFDLPVAFGPQQIDDTLGEVLSREGLKQLRIAETEKYAHVTFFFNGGVEVANQGEDRVLIQSPQEVATYDQKPEMSAEEVTDKLLELLDDGNYDVIILNYANCDMVGHSGDFDAAVKAVEAVERGVSQIVPAILERGGQVLLTADHGNAEQMKEEDGSPFTAHTINPVPLAYLGGPVEASIESGILADIAPTMLDILGIEKPESMTGKSLIKNK
ncbi:2,3-bisphosphoglycerate-independent phosphoglycerate mutase [Halanaerobiaceae bacterium Z-7014]|uniref:2,3-bisphosphoglycerate-independent phosphoglycerate mutase n=1 Tax=Halonatronomonas betaini TaxID=2778430 RepID=A0A931APP0_9FIRM|nr:2,3-bisphosphoglycerate-independent phosphoglycerate mutase [Halonatronomonas betaini]MBF8435754.1 2,3-bisphosphoglycerate-independent phosphoglycerate mutase [Halonatronomonas betaini]